jgi:hypothetical protein
LTETIFQVELDGMWTAYSINKEEIGVSFAPIASLLK